MSTGVQTSDEAVAVFRVFKAAKNSDLFAIFRIADGKIVHEHTGSSETSFQDFMSLLPDDDCRYVAFKANYTTTDGRPATKIANISWSPDTASVRAKMVYAGSKDAFSKLLEGTSVKLQCTDRSELTEEAIHEACRRF